MLYGSGEYDVPRNYSSSPAPRVRPEAVGIADKHRGVGMHTCLNHPTISVYGRKGELFVFEHTCFEKQICVLKIK